MNTLLTDKKINIIVFLLLAVVSVFFLARTINEFKASRYIKSSSQYPNVIYVNGHGEIKAIPDIAILNIDLSKEAVTAKESQNLLNETISKTLDYLKTQEIEEKDIKSEYSGLNPKYSYEREFCYTYPCPPREQKITGYVATQNITIKIREVDKANEIKTGLASLGITNISGPTFSIDDEENYKNQARALSIKDAQKKAEILAKDLGVKLGKIVNFSENNDGFYPTYRSEMAFDGMGVKAVSAPELPKGENTITSHVTITYEIR